MTPSHAHHAPVKVGVLDLRAMSHMFYEAGWWIAQGQNSSITEESAFANDWRTMAMHIVIPLTNLYHPTVMSVASEPAKILHNADVLGSQMITIFLEYLHTRGPDAAMSYARSMQARRDSAQAQVLALYQQARDHNAEVAQQAKIIATTLADTIFVCEIAMIAIGLVITFSAAAPVLLCGAEVGGIGTLTGAWSSTVVSAGYGIAAEAVKDKSQRVQAVAISGGKSVLKKGLGEGAKAWNIAAAAKLGDRLATHQAAVAKVEELHARMGAAGNPLSKAITGVKAAGAQLGEMKAGAGVSAAKPAAALSGVAKNGLPIIFAAYSAFSSWTGLTDRLKQVE